MSGGGVGGDEFADAVGDVDGHLDGAGLGAGAGAGVGDFEIGDDGVELLGDGEADGGLELLFVYHVDG